MDISLNEIKKLGEEKICYVDTRSKIAYEHGHIPNAIHMEQGLSMQEIFELLPQNKILVVYCSIGENSRKEVEKLTASGYRVFNLSGGYKSWLLEEYTQLNQDDILRYERQIILPEVGSNGQEKLKKSSVLIIGAGGLGSPAALYLAAAGIGKIGIADADIVSISNLQRQILHSISDLGVNKAKSAKQCIEKINDSIDVEVYPHYVDAENISKLIQGYDFVIDAVDNFETKFLINDACVLAGKPFCHAGILRFEGQVMTYVPGEFPCYRCIFENIPEPGTIPNCSQAGIIGVVAGIVGCIQALEAIKYLLEIGELLVGKMLIFDGLTMGIRIADFKKKSAICRVCGDKKDILNVKDNASEYIQAVCDIK